MINQKKTGTSKETLVDMLASKISTTRQIARKALVSLGKPAVPLLIKTLENSKVDHFRWEAAKTLGAIGDIRAIPSLVKALEDRNMDVRWLAAEALNKFKKNAWNSLLEALLESKEDSVLLREGAHHVLRNQKEAGFNDLLVELSRALKSSAAAELTPIAANELLNRMRTK
ncbi:MAG: HEAT repeat domain-containing protein [Bacteroidetes bacterium]|nr:HEAT repeat domain-containing protein [Bacteroidota bacterium]